MEQQQRPRGKCAIEFCIVLYSLLWKAMSSEDSDLCLGAIIKGKKG